MDDRAVAGGRKRRAFVGGAAALGMALAAGAGELAVRSAGFEPMPMRPRPDVVLLEPDAELGWKPAPGEYQVRDVPERPAATVTILEDGSRRASSDPPEGPERWLIGGSFIFGFGLSDEETLAWKLQAGDADHRYVNWGVTAYSGYQSLLRLERRLADAATQPETVLYGLIRHHEMRNIAYGGWPTYLTSRGRGVELPYCDAEGGRLVRLGSFRRRAAPFREHSALAQFLDVRWARAASEGRRRRAGAVRDAVVAAMRDACRAAGARFAVLLLDGEESAALSKPLERLGIPHLSVSFGKGPEWTLSATDTHPNARATSVWAEEVSAFLRGLSEGVDAADGRL